jgi:hypothetical protein
VSERFDFFLGGVIQGSVTDRTIMPQDYRLAIREAVARKTPGRTVYDPVENHAGSVEYTDEEAAGTFLHHIELLRRCGFFIAYLPSASMGTAIEMWECRRPVSPPVIAITPMGHNWVVRIFSGIVLKDVAEFEEWLSEENLKKLAKDWGNKLRGIEPGGE